VPLSLFLGYDRFEQFLQGAEEMDIHAASTPEDQNLPLVAALINVWNYYHLGYRVQGIIPYAAPLSKLAPHIQQLYMESNGKGVTAKYFQNHRASSCLESLGPMPSIPFSNWRTREDLFPWISSVC